MSPIRQPSPVLSDIDAPFIDLIIAFFRQVLHVPSPEYLAIRDFSSELDIPESKLWRRLFPDKYTVTIVLDTPLPSIGDRIQLFIVSNGSTYSIKGLLFESGWQSGK